MKQKDTVQYIIDYFFKSKLVLSLNILAAISLILALLSSFNIKTKINFFIQLITLFPTYLWLMLSIAFILAGVFAYFEKYSLMVLPLIAWLLFTTAVVRTSNMPGLKDVTTDDWTLGPDLDPYLFLRNAIEINEGKNIGDLDQMRYAPLGAPNYRNYNLMPWAIYSIYKVINVFGDFSVTYAAIIAPVIFFIISLIGFFLFNYFVFSFKLSKTKSLIGATIASVFYSFVPTMLHRTVAGIPELESLGIMFFWFAFLFFTLAWKSNNTWRYVLFGILAGIFTGLMSWTWGGYKYIYMTFALSTLIIFIFQKEFYKNFVIYLSFLCPAIFIEFLKVRSLSPILRGFTDTGLALGILFFMIIYIIISNKNINKKLKLDKLEIPKSILVILISVILIFLFSLVVNPSLVFNLVLKVIEGLLTPFGSGRVGLTVAENKVPYFTDVLGSFGFLFWIFFFGLILLFYESVKHFKLKERTILNSFFVFFLLTFLFSRISPVNMLNGENFISKLLYLGGIILFGIVVLTIYIKSYKKDKGTFVDFSKIDFSYILLISLSFWAVVSMRGAVRLFFIVAPILIITAVYLPLKIIDYIKSKDEAFKFLFISFFVVIILVLGQVFVSYSYATTRSAQSTVPSIYNNQWQRAMGWVRNETPEGSIFTHWWDYGYWTQSLGERPTVSDGGHNIDWWDHTIGRYLLTTPNPETALSLLKTHNVSYLLIDSTDLGKYGAFSKIGSDETEEDRFSYIPVMPNDPRQTAETINSINYVYTGGYYIDEDINYESNGTKIFLPAWKAVAAGIILEVKNEEGQTVFGQPEVAYFYNNNQYRAKMRYVYLGDQLIDFGTGVEAVARVIPSIESNRYNPLGAVIYLSPKVKDGLFAQLYLMDDPFNNYETIKIAHTEHDVVIQDLMSKNLTNEEFIYYQGFRGPIKIWDTREIPDEIMTREEFLYAPEGWNQGTGPWGSLDELEFSR